MVMRQYSFFDQVCLQIDQAVRALTNNSKTTGKPYPARGFDEPALTDEERKHAAGLMRVNHVGEICAQALYQGQYLTSKSLPIATQMQKAALEEGDHLAWCAKRLSELNSRTSYLNPFWYAGSLTMGVLAGMIGDAWSLSFLAETERQVVLHLKKHLHELPENDIKSRDIVKQMQADEAQHRAEAIAAGAQELSNFIKKIMGLTSKVMVNTAYWI